MEVVSCYCKKCDSEVGRFRNSWIGIGNTYFSPSYPPLSVDGIQATGDVYDAARDSQIQDSVLQDIACERCNEILGLRCDKAPEEHLLKKDQLILRLSEMSVLSEFSGKKAKISILKTNPLTFAPGLRRTSGERVPSPVPSPRRSVPRSLVPVDLISREPSPSRPATPPAIDLGKFKSWAEDAINSQTRDIDRLSGTVDRLERDMRSFKEFMEETRAELSSMNRPRLIEENNEIKSLRDELVELRQRVVQNGSLMTRGSLDIAKSVDVVVEDVQRIAQKTDEVDILKVQLGEMRSQIQSLETKQNSMAVSETDTRRRTSALDKRKYGDDHEEYTIEEVRRLDGASAKRRKVSGAESSPTSSPSNDRSALDAGRDRYHTPSPVVTEIPSSSGLDLPPGLFVQQDEAYTSDLIQEQDQSDFPDASTPFAMSEDDQERGMTSSTVRVVINSSLKPSMMMPLRNGTILDAGSRNEFLDVSHIEAATGRKRGRNGVWQPVQVQKPQSSLRPRGTNKPGLNAVFANGLVGNSNLSELEQERRRSLRPRKEQTQTNLRPTTEVESYDGPPDDETWTPGNDGDGEERVDNRERRRRNHIESNDATYGSRENDGKFKKPAVPVKISHAGFPSMAALSRSARENTAPPVEWPNDIEASDKLALPHFYKCGTCNKQYRTLQALDYHHEHSEYCRKGANDVVPEAFKCGSCQKLFNSFTGIRNHMQKKICLNGTPRRIRTSSLLKCETCNKKFKNEAQLDEHLCFPRGSSVMPASIAMQETQAFQIAEPTQPKEPAPILEATETAGTSKIADGAEATETTKAVEDTRATLHSDNAEVGQRIEDAQNPNPTETAKIMDTAEAVPAMSTVEAKKATSIVQHPESTQTPQTLKTTEAAYTIDAAPDTEDAISALAIQAAQALEYAQAANDAEAEHTRQLIEDAAREEELAQRERLVRETLEREMGWNV